jgi:hypothetical protein
MMTKSVNPKCRPETTQVSALAFNTVGKNFRAGKF